MAKALQCPDCGHRHPLDEFAAYRTFRCGECRRLLKVPTDSGPVKAIRESGEVKVPAGAKPTQKKIPPSQRGEAIREQKRQTSTRGVAPEPGVVSRGWRAAIWLVAVPVGLIPVLILGRLLGILTVDRAIDIFIGVGFGRFLVPLLVLPAWAAATATIAHFTIEGLARRRAQGTSA